MTDLKFPNFDDIPVSTKTFIVMTNIKIDIQKLFEFLPITDYTIVPKRRGRKKKHVLTDPNSNIPDGSIISLDLANKIRGVFLKKVRKKERKNNDYFRNSLTVIMIIDSKKINFKISNNGKFQMTGCKFDEQAEKSIKYIWSYIKDTDIYELPRLNKNTFHPFKATFIPAMRNIDFSLGFLLDREKLDEYINLHTDYFSLLETSIGYTGVNIKVPVKKSIKDLKIKQIIYYKKWTENTVSYDYFLSFLKEKERIKKLEKERFNTFLVFHSGKVIMSSMCAEFARDTYYEFLDMIKENYELFKEKLRK